jgi:hypothetical protein
LFFLGGCSLFAVPLVEVGYAAVAMDAIIPSRLYSEATPEELRHIRHHLVEGCSVGIFSQIAAVLVCMISGACLWEGRQSRQKNAE